MSFSANENESASYDNIRYKGERPVRISIVFKHKLNDVVSKFTIILV